MSAARGHIKAAPLASPRLQRVLRLMRNGRTYSTREVVRKAGVMAVSACMAELRHHGAEIQCIKQACPNGGGMRFYYTMTKAPNE